MLSLASFFTPLNFFNLAVFLVFWISCEVIGFALIKTLIKKIPDFLRGAVWLLGLGLIIFFYFLSHFFMPYAWPAIGICLAILLIPSLSIYIKEKGWQSLIGFWKENYLPLLILLPVLPVIYIKVSLPPYAWDEMAYHYISPFTLYHEQAWKVSIGLYDNLPRLLETAYIALFSLTKTYATARLLHFSIFITALIVVYKFLKDNFGLIPALVYFALMAYHGESLILRATSGYIDVGAASLVMIGIVCLASFFLKNNIGALIVGAAFWGMAAGIKYSTLISLAAYLLVVFVLIWKRKLLKRKYLKAYSLAILLFLLLGGYWYIKNFIYIGNPIYPFLFGCKITRCTKEAMFGGWTIPFTLGNLKAIFHRVLSEDKRLAYLFLMSILLSFFHSKQIVRKLIVFLLSIFGLEIFIAGQFSGYEPRYFYHWQMLSIFFIALSMTPLFNYKKIAKKILSLF